MQVQNRLLEMEIDESSSTEEKFLNVIGCLKSLNLKCSRMIDTLISDDVASNPLNILHSTVTQCEYIASYALEIANNATETIENVDTSTTSADVESLDYDFHS